MLKLLFVCLLGSVCLCAQQRSESFETAQARAKVENLRKQVDAGIAPRVKLEQAEDTLADLLDADLLAGKHGEADLTEDDAVHLQESAARRLQKREADLEKHRALVASGAEAAQELEPLVAQEEYAKTLYDLSVQRVDLIREITAMALIEVPAPETEGSSPEQQSAAIQLSSVEEKFEGHALMTPGTVDRLKDAFEKEFHKSLPISAEGETAAHRALGFDHRGRIDVAIQPDTPEGIWLRHYLEAAELPYYAFREAVAGRATGAHIHIGPPSTRL